MYTSVFSPSYASPTLKSGSLLVVDMRLAGTIVPLTLDDRFDDIVSSLLWLPDKIHSPTKLHASMMLAGEKDSPALNEDLNALLQGNHYISFCRTAGECRFVYEAVIPEMLNRFRKQSFRKTNWLLQLQSTCVLLTPRSHSSSAKEYLIESTCGSISFAFSIAISRRPAPNL